MFTWRSAAGVMSRLQMLVNTYSATFVLLKLKINNGQTDCYSSVARRLEQPEIEPSELQPCGAT